MSEQYFVDMNGTTGGPFSLEEMRVLFSSGKISGATLYSKPGSVAWMPLETIRPLFASPPPFPQAAAPFQSPPNPITSKRVTTQLTGKGIKVGIALCVVGMILGIVFALAYPVCWVLVFVFFCGFLLFRALKWFQHE